MEGRRLRQRPQRSTSVFLAALAASVVAVLGPPRVHKVDRRHPHLVFFQPGPSKPESSPPSKGKKSAPGIDEQPSRPVDSDAVRDSGRKTSSTPSFQLVQLLKEDQGTMWQWKQYCFGKGFDGSLHVKNAPVELVEQFLAARSSGAIEEVDLSPDDYVMWLDEVKKNDLLVIWHFVQYCNSECFGIRDPKCLPAEKLYPFMAKYVAGEFEDPEMADKDTIDRLSKIKDNCIDAEWYRLTDEHMLGLRNPFFFPRTDAQRFLEYFELRSKEKEQQSIEAAAEEEFSTKPLQQLLAEIAGSDQSVQVATKSISYSFGSTKAPFTATVNIPLQFTGLAGNSKMDATRSAAEKALQVLQVLKGSPEKALQVLQVLKGSRGTRKTLSNLVLSFLKGSPEKSLPTRRSWKLDGMTKYSSSQSEEGSYVATVVLTDELRGKVPDGTTLRFVGVARPTKTNAHKSAAEVALEYLQHVADRAI